MRRPMSNRYFLVYLMVNLLPQLEDNQCLETEYHLYRLYSFSVQKLPPYVSKISLPLQIRTEAVKDTIEPNIDIFSFERKAFLLP